MILSQCPRAEVVIVVPSFYARKDTGSQLVAQPAIWISCEMIIPFADAEGGRSPPPPVKLIGTLMTAQLPFESHIFRSTSIIFLDLYEVLICT